MIDHLTLSDDAFMHLLNSHRKASIIDLMRLRTCSPALVQSVAYPFSSSALVTLA